MDDIVAKAEATGGSVDMSADDVSGVGRLAYIRDTKGNMLGIIKPVEGGAVM